MNKDNINWEEFGKVLLWYNIVSRKNEDSGYDINGEGEIGRYRFSSIIDPFSYKALTWKELAIELGLGEEFGLFWDGHDCDICPDKDNCHAFFKGDKDHERCNWWMKNMNKKDK